jgi:hypothetical protein
MASSGLGINEDIINFHLVIATHVFEHLELFSNCFQPLRPVIEISRLAGSWI